MTKKRGPLFKLKKQRGKDAPAVARLLPGKEPNAPMVDHRANEDPLEAAMEAAGHAVPALLTPEQVAGLLGVSDRTLERWRSTGEGPSYMSLRDEGPSAS